MKKSIKIEIKSVVAMLWKLRDADKSFFKTHGKMHIKQLVKNVQSYMHTQNDSEVDHDIMDGWIKESKQKPESGTAVNVFCDSIGPGNHKSYVTTAFYAGGYWHDVVNDKEVLVKLWKKLPKAPIKLSNE